MKRLLPKHFSNLQAAIALSTHAQNASYIVVGALRYYYNIDSRAVIALSTHAQNVFSTVVGALRLDYVGLTNGYRTLYTCTKRFLQTVVVKRIVHEEKCAEGAKKIKYKSETIVSGVKKIAKKPKVSLKSSKIAPKAPKILGNFGKPCSQSSEPPPLLGRHR